MESTSTRTEMEKFNCANFKCWNIKKSGRLRKECNEEKNKKDKKCFLNFDSDKSSQNGTDLFVIDLATHAIEDVWLIELGASFHMTSHRDWFSKYEEYDGGKVYLGDESHLKTISCGRVKN